MKNPLVSIIVPVYNSSKYLCKCLDSIVGQSYTNIEVILVDDGGTDDSPQICDNYASKDKRLKVIHKKNEGVVCARRAGVSICSGDFIQFVDSDDWVCADMCERMIKKAVQSQSDIVWCNYYFVQGKNLKLPSFNYDSNPKQLLHNVFLGKFPWNIFNIIYRRKTALELFCNNAIVDNYAEDLLITAVCLLKNPKMDYVPETLYYYNRNVDNSLVLNLNTLGKGLYAGRNNVAHLFELLLQEGVFEEYRYEFSKLVFNIKIFLLWEMRIQEARNLYPFAHKDKMIFNTFGNAVKWIYWGAFNWGIVGNILFRSYTGVKMYCHR